MKNIQRILALALVVFFTACEETNPDVLVGGDGDANLSGSQYANIDPPTQVNFLYQGTTEVPIDLGKFESEGSTISNVEITKTLTLGGVESDPVTYTVTADVFTQTLAELFADVPIGGAVQTEDDMSPGDSWSFSYVVNLSGNAPTSDNKLEIATSTFVPFSCVSEIPTDGTWSGVTTEGAFANFGSNTEVTLTSLDDSGNYSMTDITAGFYAAFGFNLNQPGNINDLCNGITVTGAPDAQFALGQSATNTGSWDSATETLVVAWYDSGNDIDEISVYTRN